MTFVKRFSFLALLVIAVAGFAGCNKNPVINLPGPAPARMFVADTINGLVVYAQPISQASTPSFTIAGASTIGLAVDAAGNLYVSNSGSNTIAVYAPPVSATSTPVFTIGPIGGAVGLRGMNFDATGQLYVADNPGSQVFVFTPPFSGTSVPSKTITGMLNPENAVFDRAGDMINVGFNSSNVYIFRPPFANGPNVPAAILTLPGNGGGIAIDLKDDLVVGINDGSLVIFTPPFATGNSPVATIAPPTISGATATEALNMAFDSSGNLWVPYAGFNLPGQPGVAVFAPPFTSGSVPLFGFSAGLAGPFGIAFAP